MRGIYLNRFLTLFLAALLILPSLGFLIFLSGCEYTQPKTGAPGSEIVVYSIPEARFGSSQGSGAVLFGGVEAEVLSWSTDAIRVVVPDIDPGSYVVKVRTDGGQVYTCIGRFRVTPSLDPPPQPEFGKILHYNFDEGAGDTVHDLSGNELDAGIGGATWVAGKSGNALHFDGVDDFLNVTLRDDGQYVTTEELTVEMRISYEINAIGSPPFLYLLENPDAEDPPLQHRQCWCIGGRLSPDRSQWFLR